MKFSALREDFLDAVQTVQYSASAKGMMPILSGIKIESGGEGLVLHSTDLEAYTITSCIANVEREGVCVVNMKVLMDFIRDLKDEKVGVEIMGNEMVLEGKKAVAKLFTMPAEDFPNPPSVDVPVLEGMESAVFIPAVQKVSRAASKDEKRPTLLGILLEVEEGVVNMVSTDSYRLAIHKIKEGYRILERGSYIIPSTALVSLARIVGKEEKMRLYRDENGGQVRFEAGTSNHIVRLIEGKFPKYGQFIPERLEKTVETDKEELLGALKRSALIGATVRMRLSAEGIKLASESREVGEEKEEVAATYDGEEMDIAFNNRFLEDGIACIDGEKVLIGVSEPLKPGIIKGKDGEEFMYIIMPIRI